MYLLFSKIAVVEARSLSGLLLLCQWYIVCVCDADAVAGVLRVLTHSFSHGET